MKATDPHISKRGLIRIEFESPAFDIHTMNVTVLQTKKQQKTVIPGLVKQFEAGKAVVLAKAKGTRIRQSLVF